MKKIKTIAGSAVIAASAIAGMGGTAITGIAGYAAVALATTSVGVADAEARRMGGSSFSRSSSSSSSRALGSNSSRAATANKPVTPAPTPSVAPKPVATSPATSSSMIGSKVAPKPAVATRPMATSRPVARTWNTTPAQRVSNGSMVKPLLIGAAAGIGGAMLYDWLTSPSTSTTTTTTTSTGAENNASSGTTATAGSNLQIVNPAAEFKKFEGSEIPEQYQEIMKKQGLSVEAKTGNITEYAKKLKTKSGVEFTVDVAELPVLVVYVNEEGKPAEALFMPI